MWTHSQKRFNTPTLQYKKHWDYLENDYFLDCKEMYILTATDSDMASRIFPIAVFEPTPTTTDLARPTVTTVPYKCTAASLAT